MIVQDKWKGVYKIGVLRPISRFISKTVKDTATVTTEENTCPMTVSIGAVKFYNDGVVQAVTFAYLIC